MARKIILVLCFLGCMSVYAQTIKMGLFLLEPFMVEKNAHGQPGGITVDYWREYVAPGMGMKLEVVGIFPVLRLMKMLENGEIDVIPLMTKIPYREERFLFPESQLTEIISCLILRPDSKINNITRPEDLFGLKVAFLEAAYVPPIMDHPEIIIETVSADDYRDINLRKLFTGRVDAQLDINYLSLMYYLEQHGLIDKVKIVFLPTHNESVYSIFQMSERGKMLRDKFEQINSEALRNNVFETLARKQLQPYYELYDANRVQ
ncbi:MAG: transporter substrate-binding domain-containing protein [Spirochaetales bacterium]|nr:transporter substrate-binding domain-containing protein [Spirochaetales bacterium]